MNKVVVVVVLIAIIAIGLVAYFVLIPAVVTPCVAFKGWHQSGVEVTTAKVGVPVTLTLEATSVVPLEGALKVEIREDIESGNDKAMATKTFEISLEGKNDTETVEAVFTPTSKTEGKSKGYFYRLSWKDKLFYDPQDRNSRNQLTVGEEALTTTLTQTFEGWYQNRVKLVSPSATHPEAKVNVPVTLNVSVTNNGDNLFSGTVKIEIRKDVVGGNDKSVGFYPSQISIASGASVIIKAVFTPDEKTSGSLRGYFYKVYVGELAIYDPTSENGQGPDVRPELKVTDGGESSVTWEPPGEWEA